MGEVEGLLFGLKLGTLIPLIPPFYCQLFPSYRRICTEFRICATVHHSNLYPTDAALSFISSINTPPPAPPLTPQPFPPLDVHSNIHFSFCSPPISVTSPHLAVTAPWHGDRLNWKVFVHRGPSEHDASQRKKKKKLILILSIHTGRHGCAPLSLVVPKKKTALKHWPGLLRKLHLPIMKQSARVCVQMQALEEDTVFAY